MPQQTFYSNNMEKLEKSLEEFIFPFSRLRFELITSPTKVNIIQAVETVRRYFYSDDCPHDKDLYLDDLIAIKNYIEFNYPIDKFPEYYI